MHGCGIVRSSRCVGKIVVVVANQGDHLRSPPASQLIHMSIISSHHWLKKWDILWCITQNGSISLPWPPYIGWSARAANNAMCYHSPHLSFYQSWSPPHVRLDCSLAELQLVFVGNQIDHNMISAPIETTQTHKQKSKHWKIWTLVQTSHWP